MSTQISEECNLEKMKRFFSASADNITRCSENRHRLSNFPPEISLELQRIAKSTVIPVSSVVQVYESSGDIAFTSELCEICSKCSVHPLEVLPAINDNNGKGTIQDAESKNRILSSVHPSGRK